MSRLTSRLCLRTCTAMLLLVATVLAPVATSSSASAAPGDVGYQDFVYGSPAGSGWVDPDLGPTASKPQSKLWYADGQWWGVLKERSSGTYRIHKLDLSTHTWSDTGVVVDSRSGSRADALWTGSKLYTASANRNGTGTGNGIQIRRYSYSGGSYSLDSGFPVTISSGGIEAAVIARDTTDRFWVAYTQGSRVRVVTSEPGGATWGSSFIPSVSGTTVAGDDIATIAAYNGQVSVVWSNQNDDSIYQATHVDGTSASTWQSSRKVITGPNEADDHINMTSVEGDSAGRLFVAVKTGMNDVGPSTAPLVYLLVLGTDDVWRRHTVWRVSDGVTRPIVLLDRANSRLHVLAPGPEVGGVVYHKSTPLSSISFATGKGDPFLKLASDANINNPTSTKQALTADTGMLVLASDQHTARYVHNHESLGGNEPPPPSAPTAAFTGSPTSGDAPLPVSFTDQSTGDPTQWSWDFGDGGTSTAQNPSHTYDEPGTYTVKLTASNSGGSNTVTKNGYITVTDGGGTEPPPPGNYVDSVTGDTPTGYWRMGGTGTTVTATVGSNGTANGGVTSVAGTIGDDGARAFNGSTGYVSVPSSAALNTTGDFAIEAWARPAAATGGVVVQKGGASGYSVWQYRLAITSGGQWRGTVFVGSTAYAVTAPGSAALNQWSHLALVRSGSSLSIYVNGQLAATANAPGTLNSTTGMFAIGRSGASSSSYFNGAIDEVAFYNHTISAASISARASQGGG